MMEWVVDEPKERNAGGIRIGRDKSDRETFSNTRMLKSDTEKFIVSKVVFSRRYHRHTYM